MRYRLVAAFGDMRVSDLKSIHRQNYYGQALRSGRVDGRGELNARLYASIM